MQSTAQLVEPLLGVLTDQPDATGADRLVNSWRVPPHAAPQAALRVHASERTDR